MDYGTVENASAPNNSGNNPGMAQNMFAPSIPSMSTMSNSRHPVNSNSGDMEAPKHFPGKGQRIGK